MITNPQYKALRTVIKAVVAFAVTFGGGYAALAGVADKLPEDVTGFTWPAIFALVVAIVRAVENFRKNAKAGDEVVWEWTRWLKSLWGMVMGENFLVLAVAGAVGILVCGCATTPDSIKELSVQEMQMLRALQEDAENVVDAYDDEVRHWVELAFKQAMTNVENDIVREDGSVVLAEYKERVREVAAQMGASIAEYDQNKADTLGALSEKFDKALLMMMLIDEYEKSTGTSPETWAALSSELGGLAIEVHDVYKQNRTAREAADAANRLANPTLQDRLTVMGHGVFDALYERVISGVETIGTQPVPEPVR